MGSTDLRRRHLIRLATATGGVGLAATAAPFVTSLAPSERARALGAAVRVDVSDLPAGKIRTIEWRGRPVLVLRRTPVMLKGLMTLDGLLADPLSRRSEQPDGARNAHRSLLPEIGVLEGVCTHLGCVPTYRPQPAASDLGADWPGGFFCPCHGSRFDLAGRVLRNVPAPTNLVVPPYRHLAESVLLVGDGDSD